MSFWNLRQRAPDRRKAKRQASFARKRRARLGLEHLEARQLLATLGAGNVAVLDFDGATITDVEMRQGGWDEPGRTYSSFYSLFTNFSYSNPWLDLDGDNDVNATDGWIAVNRIVEKVLADFAPYDLQLMFGNHNDSALTDSIVGDATVVITGGDNVIEDRPALGLAPVDHGNRFDEIAFVFGNAIADEKHDADQFINSVARTISHELGHTFGLEHEVGDPSGEWDPISHSLMGVPAGDGIVLPVLRDYPHDFNFHDRDYIAEHVGTQNAHEYLSNELILGPSRNEWMAVLRPGELTVSQGVAVGLGPFATLNVTVDGATRNIELTNANINSFNPFDEPISRVQWVDDSSNAWGDPYEPFLSVSSHRFWDGAPDQIEINVNQSTLIVTINGEQVHAGPTSGIGSLYIFGSLDADTITLSEDFTLLGSPIMVDGRGGADLLQAAGTDYLGDRFDLDASGLRVTNFSSPNTVRNNRITLQNVEQLEVVGGVDSNVIEVTGVPAGLAQLSIDGAAGDDRITIAGSVPDGTRLFGGDDDDEIVIDNGAFANVIEGAVIVDGGAGFNSLRVVDGFDHDTFIVDDVPGPNHRVFVASDIVTQVLYSNVNDLHIQAGAGFDRIFVQGVAPTTSLTVEGGEGRDKLHVSGSVRDVQFLGGGGNDEITIASSAAGNQVRVNGGDGSDSLRIVRGADDDEFTVGDYWGPEHSVLVSGPSEMQVLYFGLENLYLQAGAGDDTVHVFDHPSTTYLTVEGGDGDDQITFESSASPHIRVVEGGDGSDSLRIVKGADDDEFSVGEYGNGYHYVWVRSAFETLALYRDLENLHLQAGGGDDTLLVSNLPSITSLTVEGGEGEDRLDATAAPRGVGLDGGDGDDTLIGSAFNDLVIGGEGADRIEGRDGDDLLIGGATVYDDAAGEALQSILAEWTSDRDYLTRAQNLRDPQRAFFLATEGDTATVFTDEVADELVGVAGRDWFFAQRGGENADGIYDLAADEAVDELAPVTLDFNRYATRDTAYRLGDLSGSLQLANAELRNEQWFRFDLTEPANVTIALDFLHDDGDLDMYLYAGDNDSPLDESANADDGERISGDLPAGEYFLQVIGYNGAQNHFDLSLDVGAAADTTDGECSTHDAAHDFGALSGPVQLAEVTLQDDQWYRFEVTEPTNVTIALDFLHDDGDLDMYLYAGDRESLLEESAGADDGERISGDLAAGVYYLRVIGYNGAQNVYDLSLDVGAAAANATRDAAHDFGALSGAVQVSDVELRIDHWYRFEVTQPTSMNIALDFLHDEGDLDMYLYAGDDDSPLDESANADDGEAIALQLEPGVYYLRIVGYNGAQNHYDLSLDADE